MSSLPARPQLTVGLATTSTDRNLDGPTDRTFRQTGLHGNWSSLGDSDWLPYYGIALEPDLSNLQIFTAAIGLSVTQESVVVLVYHDYEQVTAADFLYSSSLDISPLGNSTDIGRSIGLIVPFNEWQPWDARLMLGAFDAGRAFGDQRGERSYRLDFHVGYEF